MRSSGQNAILEIWVSINEQTDNDRVFDRCLQQIDDCSAFCWVRPESITDGCQKVPEEFPFEALEEFGWIQDQSSQTATELEIIHGAGQFGYAR